MIKLHKVKLAQKLSRDKSDTGHHKNVRDKTPIQKNKQRKNYIKIIEKD